MSIQLIGKKYYDFLKYWVFNICGKRVFLTFYFEIVVDSVVNCELQIHGAILYTLQTIYFIQILPVTCTRLCVYLVLCSFVTCVDSCEQPHNQIQRSSITRIPCAIYRDPQSRFLGNFKNFFCIKFDSTFSIT